MKSLFEKEEKETDLNQLKVDLISRFYPFSKEEVLHYKDVLNFDRHHLMQNDMIDWNKEQIEILTNKIDWTAIWKIKNISLDYEFFRKYDSKICYKTIHYSQNIKWSDNLLAEFGHKFDWSDWLITKEPLSTIDNLRRFKDKLDWFFVSKRIKIKFNENVIEEFSDNWNWKMLSSNKNLPVTVEFIKKYIDQLDFDALSQNPQSLDLIFKYPTSKKWNWEKVILNPAIVYTKETFDFIFHNYKKQFEAKEFTNPILKKSALHSFLFHVFTRQYNELSFFLSAPFIKYMPWKQLCQICKIKLPLEFIEEHKYKLDFNQTEFTRIHKEILNINFIIDNKELFNFEHYSFYYLPLSIDLLNTDYDKINWPSLSSCEKLDWSWEFIEENFDKFNLYRLSQNKGIYEKLIIDKLTKQDIFVFLDNQIAK
jgi:hypothetical protein